MNIKLIPIVAVGFAIFSCSNGRDSGFRDKISGAYAREYSFKVVEPETGNEIGMRTIRDTIFIRSKENDYEVSNNKWRLNDYDKEGWQNMEHADDRPLPSYRTTFDPVDNTLRPVEPYLGPTLSLDPKKGLLFKGRNGADSYAKPL